MGAGYEIIHCADWQYLYWWGEGFRQCHLNNLLLNLMQNHWQYEKPFRYFSNRTQCSGWFLEASEGSRPTKNVLNHSGQRLSKWILGATIELPFWRRFLPSCHRSPAVQVIKRQNRRGKHKTSDRGPWFFYHLYELHAGYLQSVRDAEDLPHAPNIECIHSEREPESESRSHTTYFGGCVFCTWVFMR